MSFEYESKNQFFTDLEWTIYDKFDNKFNFKEDLKIMLSLAYYYSERYYKNYRQYGIMLPTEIVVEFTKQFDGNMAIYKHRLARLLGVIYRRFNCITRLYSPEYFFLSTVFPENELGGEAKQLFVNKRQVSA